ncbi:5645_t:CDS:2 [Diversispora eburnea]|uniref:5645_t:CDS:1 n=1 Tax=Diversispora eburnea TaxID=1213867 RepID=A0A9N8Z4K5_9GLOM|nr:5645_t:CDS:2 [Diversispora eburnea]
MTEISEIPSLLVKSGGKTINLTFKNDILSIVKLKNSSPNKFNNSISVEIKVLVPGKKLRLTNFIFEVITAEQAASWVELVRDAAYKNSKPNKHLKLVINPVSGKGGAEKIFNKDVKPIFDAASCTYDITRTERVNQANELMRTLDLKNYDAIICVGGDGTMYEVMNGILSREDAVDVTIPLGTIPTGNALNISLHGDSHGSDVAQSTLTIIKGVPMKIDICSVTQGDKRFFSFLTQSYGIVADCDLGTENMRWMGDIRFIIGTVQGILAGRRYEDWEILNDDLYLFYCGKTPWVSKEFIIFPCALPSDGLMDLVIIKRDGISKTKFINLLKCASTGAHINFNENRQDGYIGIDGERVPFEPFQVEVLPRLITLLSVDGNYCHVNI